MPIVRRQKTQKNFWEKADRRVVEVFCNWADTVVECCLYLDFSGVMKNQYRVSKRMQLGICVVFFGLGIGLVVLSSVVIDAAWVKGISFQNPFSFARLFGERQVNQLQIRDYVMTASRQYQVPPELIWAVISVESNFNPEAISPAGAVGLMQLMPTTAASLNVSDPADPYQNVLGGTRYLRYLLDRFDGKKELALAAYNAGPTAVRRHGGIPPYGETRRYVKKVLTRYKAEKAKRNQPVSL